MQSHITKTQQARLSPMSVTAGAVGAGEVNRVQQKLIVLPC